MKNIVAFIMLFFTGVAVANNSASNCTPTPVTKTSMVPATKNGTAKVVKKHAKHKHSAVAPQPLTKTAETLPVQNNNLTATAMNIEKPVQIRKEKPTMSALKKVLIGENINSATFGAGWMTSNVTNEVPPYPGFAVNTTDAGWSVQAFLNYFPSTKIALGAAYNDRRTTNELSYNGSSMDRVTERSPVELSARYYPFDFKHLFYAGIGGKLLITEGNYQMGGEKFYNYGTGIRRIFMFGADIPLSMFTGKIAGFDFGARAEYQMFDDTVTSPLPEVGNVTYRENGRWLLQGTFSFDWGDWETGY